VGRLLFIIGCAACLTAGCAGSGDIEAHVKSDTSWSGNFDGRSIDGSGSQDINMGSASQVRCVVVQKNTDVGTLSVKVDQGDPEKTTTAAFGVVSACGGGQ
jgi:hypothetical protein